MLPRVQCGLAVADVERHEALGVEGVARVQVGGEEVRVVVTYAADKALQLADGW